MSGVLEQAVSDFEDVGDASGDATDTMGINWKNVNEQIEAKWIDMISSLITNFTSFKDTLSGLFSAIFTMFADTVSKMVTEWIKGSVSFKGMLKGFKTALKEFAIFFAIWVSVNLVEHLLKAFGIIEDGMDLLVESWEAASNTITKDSLAAGDAVKKIGDGAKDVYDAVDYLVVFGEAIEKVANLIEHLSGQENISIVAQEALNDAWEEAIKLVKEYGLEGSKAFIELIQEMRELGLESEALTEYVIGQLDRIPDALSSLIAPAVAAGESLDALEEALAAQNEELAKLEEGTDAYNDLCAAIAATGAQITAATETFMEFGDDVERAGILALTSFNAMIDSGVSWTDAVAKMKDPLIALRDQYDALGLDANAALDKLFGIIDVSEAHGELFEAIDANKTILEALGNSGWLTQDALAALATDAGEFYQNLIDAGVSGDDALRMMGPTLQSLQDYANAYNLTLDDGTQALIDQATEIGVVKEAQEDNVETQERLFDRLGDKIKEIMDGVGERIVRSITGGFSEAFGNAEAAANSTASTIGGTLSAIRPRVDIGFNYAIPDFSNLKGNVDIGFNYAIPDFSGIPGGEGKGGFQYGGIAWTPQLATVAEREPEIIMPLREYRQEKRGEGGGGGIVINFAPQISAMDSQDVRKFFQTKGREEIISLLKTNLRGFGREFKEETGKF